MSISTFYSVTIAGVNGTAPADGFIDATTIEQYTAKGSNATTLAQTTTKERANVRYQNIQQQVQLEANVYLSEVTATGGSATTAPTSITFKVEVERGDSVLFTRDELNANAPLTGVAALKRWIARALVETRNGNRDIYDPTMATTPGNSNQAARYGVKLIPLTTGPLYSNLTNAEASITVTAI